MADVVKKGPIAAHTSRTDRSANPELPSDLSADRIVTVLAISPLGEDHTFLGNIFSHSKWRLLNARTWRDARGLLEHEPVPVVICESNLPDATWKDVLDEISEMPAAPLLIVSSRMVDERLWAEVLNLGGYDLLMKPFESAEVFRVVSLAWLSWKDSRRRQTAGFECARAVAS